MRIGILICIFIVCLATLSSLASSTYHYPPGRRLIALPLDAGRVFFSWRYKDSDGLQAKYEIKRSDCKTGPFTMAGIFREDDGTCFIDSTTTTGNIYYYFATTPSGISRTLEIPTRLTGQECLAIPIRKNSSVQQLALGDLNGDLLFEIVLLAKEMDSKITSLRFFVSAFNIEGENIWNTPLPSDLAASGKKLRMTVWDIDGDGMDEVIVNETGMNSDSPSGLLLTGWPIVLDPVNGKELSKEEIPKRMPDIIEQSFLPSRETATAKPLELSWDEDESLELAAEGEIVDCQSGKVLANYRGKPVCAVDFLGDWREELITLDKNKICIYTTTIPTRLRCPSPLDIFEYRIRAARGWSLAGLTSAN